MRPAPVLLACLLFLAHPVGALAWEDTGHRMVSGLAMEALPPELPGFLRTPDARWRIVELSREPDRSKGAGQPHDADLDPGHFVDVDDAGKVLGGPPLEALPPNRETYEAALQAVGANSWDAGWLPYSIVEGWQQLTKDFAYWRAARVGERTGKTRAEREWFARDRALREMLIVRDLGYWSHFVGDGSQPLHVSVHYNGWGDYPNPQGFTRDRIHSPFEGAFARANLRPETVRARIPPFRSCDCSIQVATTRYLQAGAARVEPLYRLWKEGGFQGNDPRGAAFVVEQVAFGAATLRDLIVEAWRASANATVGYPAVTARSIEESGVAPFETIYGRQ